MAVFQLLHAVTLVIFLTADGCHSSTSECGKLMDGQNPDGSLPWQALVTWGEEYKCLGSVISEWWVLTAGRCGAGPDQNAEVLLAAENDYKPHPVKDYECYFSHGSEGLCLLQLSDPLSFNGPIAPICVAGKGSAFYSGEESYVSTGSHTVTSTKVPIVGYNECMCKYSSVQKGQICAGKGTEKAASDKCWSGIGGALMNQYNMSWTLAGVAGYDQQCLTPGSFKTYTRVSHYQDWIENVTARSPPDFVCPQPRGIDPDETFICPTACNKTPRCDSPFGCDDFSIFDRGGNMAPSVFSVFLCVFALLFYSTRW